MTKKDEDTTLETLMSVYAEKTLGNVLTVSNVAAKDSDCFHEAIDRLAVTLLDAAKKRMESPVFGSGKAIITKDWMNDHTNIAMKMRSVMSCSPEKFIVFAAHMIEEEREKACGAEYSAKEAQGRYNQLMGKIAKAKTLRALRNNLDFDRDEY